MPDELKPEQSSNDTRHATPYLYIPKESWAPVDVEKDDPASVGWILGPSIFLINENTSRFELAPRSGVAYRLLTLVGNAGEVPSLRATVEFNLQQLPFSFSSTYNPEPLRISRVDDVVLGATSLVVPQSKVSNELVWAMSPLSKKFQWSAKDFDNSTGDFAAIVKVYDILHDRTSSIYEPQKDRKTAARHLLPNFSGHWEGIEEDINTGLPIGIVKLEVTQNWSVGYNEQTKSFVRPRLEMVLRDFQAFPGQYVPIGRSWSVPSSGQPHFPFNFARPKTGVGGLVLTPEDNDTLEMRTFVDLLTYNPRGRLKLKRVKAGTTPANLNLLLLNKVNMQRGSTWPQSRLGDFDILREAIRNI